MLDDWRDHMFIFMTIDWIDPSNTFIVWLIAIILLWWFQYGFKAPAPYKELCIAGGL